MGKSKSPFRSKADAESAWNSASKMAGLLERALREVVVGGVKWIDGEQPRRIGLCALGMPHGGVVILVERHMIGARYLEEWLLDVRGIPEPKAKPHMPEHRAWVDIRRLADLAEEEMRKANERAAEEARGCTSTQLPPMVDQDVRQY